MQINMLSIQVSFNNHIEEIKKKYLSINQIDVFHISSADMIVCIKVDSDKYLLDVIDNGDLKLAVENSNTILRVVCIIQFERGTVDE